MAQLKDFQCATVERIDELFRRVVDVAVIRLRLLQRTEKTQARKNVRPLVRRRRGLVDDEIEGFKSKCAHIEEVIDAYNQSIEEAKKQIVELDADIEKYRKQLENISNSREYDSINKEIENTALLRAIAEKNIKEAYEAIEQRKEDLEHLSDKILIREDDLKAKNEELAVIVESTAKQEEELMNKRNACAAKIDERTISAYERIRSSVHNHLAVVPVYEQSCGGCFNAITPQRLLDIASGKKLVICEHCGRILVHPAVEK